MVVGRKRGSTAICCCGRRALTPVGAQIVTTIGSSSVPLCLYRIAASVRADVKTVRRCVIHDFDLLFAYGPKVGGRKTYQLSREGQVALEKILEATE